jgi:endonuclease/exonuclease/phosphatase family metal-dependent hydrolase
MSGTLKALIGLSVLLLCLVGVEMYTGRDRFEILEVSPPVETPKRLKLLTYNVGLLEVRILGQEVFKPSDYLSERFKYLPSAIRSVNADIVSLQELYTAKHADYLFDALSDLYPYHYRADNTLLRIKNGLMILSKYPIRKQGLVKMTDGPDEERYFASKSIMAVEVILGPDVSIDIANIHPTGGGTELAQDHPDNIAARDHQIIQAYHYLRPHDTGKFDSAYQIIMGDFNAGPEIAHTNYEALKKYGFRDAYAEFAFMKKTPMKVTWDADNILNSEGTHSDSISQRIDHVFLSKDLINKASILNAEVVFEEAVVPVEGGRLVPVSDHYGVVVEMQFKN